MIRKARHAEDLRLVKRVLRRDREAVAAFSERLSCVPAYLRSLAARTGLGISAPALDDVAQETFLAIWRKLDTFRGTSRLETWACGFCFHELRHWRDRHLRVESRRGELEESPSVAAVAPDDTGELVDRALARLGPPAEDVIRLKHFEELSFQDVGERLQVSPNTAKSLYYRGLARLREWLGDRGEELAG
ncbi:MAG: RNA polymerase sigma factor [Planctomycetota bacterium]